MENSLSLTEENYIKAIFQIGTTPESNVSTNALADSLQTKPATVSDMIKKLSHKKLIFYEKYKGVTLSASGAKEALKIIRKHRLWEVFLVNHLNFKWDQVHEIAEQLEHIKSSELVNRLDDFLGNPTIDPHGDPIPDANGQVQLGPSKLLSEMTSYENGIIVGVKNEDPLLLQHLDKINIRLGLHIEVTEVNDFDQSMQVKLADLGTLFLSEKITSQILIAKNL
ncbi:metal-dependent transcriptional regulator [Cyclobacteriaceae bacterium]|jgi:DtxR family Mn-dependent transcriptional regulator|nr:metal-dependent transcriptional regulator [Cyclobacteriaceae bacterium]|tara:strand:+ start:95 stop:766 length:672 start_codon:yes stop_codon:yes gene_type:complete